MSTTTIRDILGARPLLSVTPQTILRDVATVMAEHTVGAVTVLKGADLAGILTERDIVFRCVASGGSVDEMTAVEVMTAEPLTVGIDDALSDALAQKIGGPFRHLPVMDDGVPVGILSYRDIPAEYVMLFERFREMTSARPGSDG